MAHVLHFSSSQLHVILFDKTLGFWQNINITLDTALVQQPHDTSVHSSFLAAFAT